MSQKRAYKPCEVNAAPGCGYIGPNGGIAGRNHAVRVLAYTYPPAGRGEGLVYAVPILLPLSEKGAPCCEACWKLVQSRARRAPVLVSRENRP